MCRADDMPETRVCLCARSISGSLKAKLLAGPGDGRILSTFRRACIVQYGQDDLLAIVAPELGNGPLNAVVERIPNEWLDLRPGMQVPMDGGLLRLGGLEVSLAGAESWTPCPDWERLRASRETLLERLDLMLELDLAPFKGDSLLSLMQVSRPSEPSGKGAVQARARRAAEAMWAGWCGDVARLRAGAGQLAGLGSGLTPAGDDFLLGTMLCAWLAHPIPSQYCETVANIASPMTSVLSRAFLWSAAAGEFGASWHGFLLALEGGSAERLEDATHEVLAYGHSSGADALAGFLWMGLRARALLEGRQVLERKR